MGIALMWICFVAVLCGAVVAGVVAFGDLRWVVSMRTQLAARAKAVPILQDSSLELARKARAARSRVPAPRTEEDSARGIGRLTVVKDAAAPAASRGLGTRRSLVAKEVNPQTDADGRGLGRRLIGA